MNLFHDFFIVKWRLFLTTLIVISSTIGADLYQLLVFNSCQMQILTWISYIWPESSESDLGTLWISLIVSYICGGIVASLVAPCIIIRLGRKPTIFSLSAIGQIFGHVCLITAAKTNSVWLLFVSRFLIGSFATLGNTAVFVYIMECSPKHLIRLSNSVTEIVMISLSILGYILAFPSLLGNPTGWPYLVSWSAFLNMICLISSIWIPESPIYLLNTKHNQRDAVRSFETFYNISYTEARVIVENFEKQSQSNPIVEQANCCTVWRSNFRLLLLALTIGSLPYISQITMQTTRATGIHTLMGISRIMAQYFFAVRCLVALASALAILYACAYCPRKQLLLWFSYLATAMLVFQFLFACVHHYLGSSGGQEFGHALLGAFSFSYFLCYGAAVGGIFTLSHCLPAEIAPISIRAMVTSNSLLTNRIIALLLAVLQMQISSEHFIYMFLVDALMILLCAVYIHLKLVEPDHTKLAGRNLLNRYENFFKANDARASKEAVALMKDTSKDDYQLKPLDKSY